MDFRLRIKGKLDIDKMNVSCITTLFMVLCFGWCKSQVVEVSINAYFENCVSEGNSNITCFFANEDKYVSWGIPKSRQRSALEFIERNQNITIQVNDSTNNSNPIGILVHHNWPITGNIPKLIDFIIELNISDVSINLYEKLIIPFTLSIHETLNEALTIDDDGVCPFSNNSEWFGMYNADMPCCPYYTPSKPCSDRIKFIVPFNKNYTFVINETSYTLYIDGFINSPYDETQLPKTVEDTFITQESENTHSEIYASLISVCYEGANCDDGNECTLDQCKDGFCSNDPEAMNYAVCTLISSDRSDVCYQDYCWNGECIRNYTECDGGSYLSSSSGDGDDDDDSVDLVWLWTSLALLACLYMCLAIMSVLCLMMACPPLIYGLTVSSLPGASTSVGTDVMEIVADNPMYENLEQVFDNQLSQ